MKKVRFNDNVDVFYVEKIDKSALSPERVNKQKKEKKGSNVVTVIAFMFLLVLVVCAFFV